jgi:hypothetical protein
MVAGAFATQTGSAHAKLSARALHASSATSAPAATPGLGRLLDDEDGPLPLERVTRTSWRLPRERSAARVRPPISPDSATIDTTGPAHGMTVHRKVPAQPDECSDPHCPGSLR